MNGKSSAHACGLACSAASFLIVLGVRLCLAGRVEAQDKSVSLAFVAPQRLAILGWYPDRQLVLSRPDVSAKTWVNQALGLPVEVRSGNTLLRKDRNGQLYVAWEESGPQHSGVGFGRLTESGVVQSVHFRLPEGWNELPDLCFDPGNGPWLTWVNDRLDRQTLYVRQAATGSTWSLASAAAMLRPRILCDGQSRLWLFWGETSRTSFRILFRVFDGRQWSPTMTACDAGPLAIESFAAGVDDANSPWIAWSQHNGQSYGVYIRQQQGGTWSVPVMLSMTSNAQNFGPSLALAAGFGPVVSWVRSSARESVLCLRVLESGRWSRETVIPGVETREAIPQIAVEGDSLGIAWMSGGYPTGRVISLSRLAVPSSPPPLPRPPLGPFWGLPGWMFPTLIINPELNEASYIGYGDSITLGVINSEEHPELGYVPRLQNLLSAVFGPTEVINEGVGSQITTNGLARLDDVLAADLARYLLILEGTNDTVTLIYNPDVTGYNLQQMVIRSRNFGSFPAMGTLLPRFDDGARPERILEVNARIREFTQLLAVPLVDFYTLFNDYPATDGGVLSLMSDDKLHPNEKGYQFMAENWYETIRNFPFPPVEVQIRREYDKIFFYQSAGNMITWQDNPKIYDTLKIREYRLYRKLSAAGDDTYVLVATIQGSRQYFDTAINSDQNYTYVISTVTTVGVEGPCSVPITL
jgi:lysophospholipase L1-like esterase